MSAFDDISKKAAAAFLQTVVVVDNRASYEPATEAKAPAPDEPALVPPDPFASEEVSNDEIVADPASDDALDAAAVSRSFAKSGLVCSILRPTGAEKLEDEIVLASAHADIVVLDWHMDDSGTLATKVILRLVKLDKAAGGRLRLIVIYTGKTQLAPIRDEIVAAHSAFGKVDDTVNLVLESTKVILLTKLESGAELQEGELAVAPEHLPDRLILEFAKFAGGLLPNATLAAIAGLRRHTHRVLARFDKNLDGPFLTHRTLLPTPGDAEQFAADLILAELDAQVPIDAIVGEYLGADNVREYLEHRMEGTLQPALMLDRDANQVDPLDLVRACRLVEEGFRSLGDQMPRLAALVGRQDNVGQFKEGLKKEFHERLYRLANQDLAKSRNDHARFAERSMLKCDASSVRPGRQDTYPKLRLGSLLKGAEGYWICLTPYCDSGRIPAEGGRFLLAQLDENDRQFELVVPDGNESRKLALGKKRTNLVSYWFLPDDKENVVASIEGADAIFESVADRPPGAAAMRFAWLGELKSMHAVRFIQGFAANLARVGLDDFEWQRQRKREAQD
jgi:hypothetical protein